jgi:hypothetical protein
MGCSKARKKEIRKIIAIKKSIKRKRAARKRHKR